MWLISQRLGEYSGVVAWGATASLALGGVRNHRTSPPKAGNWCSGHQWAN